MNDEQKKRRVKLPYFGIELAVKGRSGAIVSSNLKDGSEGPALTAALDAIEALILAHACAGIDVASPAYCEGVETAVEAALNTVEDDAFDCPDPAGPDCHDDRCQLHYGDIGDPDEDEEDDE